MAQARFLRDGRAALPLRVGALLTSDAADLRSRLPPLRGCIAWCFPRVANQRQTLPPRQRQRFLLPETLRKSKQMRDDDDDGDDGHDDGGEDDADGAADDDDCDAGDEWR